jgi:murein endopeptidase
MRTLTPKYGGQNFQIRLLHDDTLETCGCLRMEARGTVFESPRPMEPMSDLIVRIECPSPECRRRAMTVEGIVVGCEKTADGWFEITVLFLQQDDSRTGASAAWGKSPKVNPALN